MDTQTNRQRHNYVVRQIKDMAILINSGAEYS